MVSLGVESRRQRQHLGGAELDAESAPLTPLDMNRYIAFCHTGDTEDYPTIVPARGAKAKAGRSTNDGKRPAAVRTEAEDGEVVIQGSGALYSETAHDRETRSVDNREILVAFAPAKKAALILAHCWLVINKCARYN
jgi:hypothetical protein